MGVIFTPDCDMEQKNTRYLDMVGLRSLDDAELGLTVGRKQSIREQNTPSYSLFPSIDQTGNGEFADFVAIMKSRLLIEEKLEEHAGTQLVFPQSSGRLTFETSFRFDGKSATLRLICSLSNPYKSDFLQRLHSHNSRVGTPNIKNLWL